MVRLHRAGYQKREGSTEKVHGRFAELPVRAPLSNDWHMFVKKLLKARREPLEMIKRNNPQSS